MTTRLRLPSAVFVLLTSVFFTAVSYQPALASSRSCDIELLPAKSDTLKSLRERNTEKMNRYIAQHPMPGFNDMAVEVQKEQIGEIAPRALQQMLGSEFKSVSSPAPSVSMDTAVNLHEEGKSFPVHVDVPWHGRRTSTTVYASLPKAVEPSGGNQYLVGPEYPVVVFHLHGGGTPTATGKNAMSIAQALAGKNIPVLAPDLAGHGRATRKMEGLMTAEQQVDWILEIMKKTVHPSVKVILSGHSWGGEFAEYMYRHSDEPKYKQIEHFFVLSAPVDVSLGGDEEKKYEWDEYYERNYPVFKKRIAAADFEFQANSHYHGKISETGSYFTYGTHMDYQTPPLSPERQRQLKPKTVIVGDADGLVYVGAEEPTRIAHSGLIGNSRYILLGEHKTWKSEKEGGKLYKTGHNIWDALNEAGKHLVYSLMEEQTLTTAGPQGMGSDEADAATTLLNNMMRQWKNNFIFRQMVASHEEYVQTPTADRTEMGLRKQKIETYLSEVSAVEAATNKQIEAKVKEALAPIKAELGLHPSVSIERAKRDLELPELTDARRAVVEAYLSAASKVGEEMHSSPPDSTWEYELGLMKKDYAKVLESAGIGELENYKIKFDELASRKGKLAPEDERLRSELSRLHQRYKEATSMRQKRFSAEKERLIALIPKPEKVTDVKSALNELSPDRKSAAVLRQYIERASAVEKTIRDAGAHNLERALSSIERPSGVTGVSMARAEREETLAREAYVYAPAGNPVLIEAAERVKRAGEKRVKLLKGSETETGLDQREKELRELVTERSKLSKTWDNAWRKKPKGEEEEDKEFLTSPRLRAHEAIVDMMLKAYRDQFLQHEHLKGLWMRGLRKDGRLNEAELLNPPKEMVELRKSYQKKKLEFEGLRDQIDQIRWEEALVGRLEGRPKDVEAATAAARALWGNSVTNPPAESLVARTRTLEALVDKARDEESIARQELERAQWFYSEEMRAAGERVPFTVTRVVIREELDLDYETLRNRLRNDSSVMSAFRTFYDKYIKHLALLRVEAQSKDAGNY